MTQAAKKRNEVEKARGFSQGSKELLRIVLNESKHGGSILDLDTSTVCVKRLGNITIPLHTMKMICWLQNCSSR